MPANDELSGEEQPEDLLDAGRPLPAWVRVVAVALLVLGGGYLGVRALHGSGGDSRPLAQAPTSPGAAHSPVTAPPLFRSPGGPRMTGTDCGPTRPEVRTRAAYGLRDTHLHLLVGGGVLQSVDFDTGRSERLEHLPALEPNEWFDSIVTVPHARYASASTVPCEVMSTRVLAVHGNRTRLVSLAPSSGIIADEWSAWTVRDPPHVLSPLTGGHDVTLPTGFVPVVATQGNIVGNLVSAMDPTEIVSINARTGRMHATAGAAGVIIAARYGQVYWTSDCAHKTRPCTLRSGGVRGQSTRSYRLPSAPAGTPGLVSPDGRHLALVVSHVADDVHPRPRNPRLDGDIAVLDLVHGGVRIVPGIALSTNYRPTFVFTPNGWLVVGYERSDTEQLIAWRPGMSRPVRSPYSGSLSPAAPPIAVAAGRP